MARWRRFFDWFAAHPWVMTAFLSGVAAGLVLCLPLFPVELPDSVAQVIGAGLGAGLAVSGAAWVSSSATRRTRSALRSAAQIAATPLTFHCDRFITLASKHSGTVDPLAPAMREFLAMNRDQAHIAVANLKSLTPAFQLAPDTMLLHHHLVEAANDFARACVVEIEKDEARREARLASGANYVDLTHISFRLSDIDAHARLLKFTLSRL